MKKLFKILRKIIKSLLKFILGLILLIIVISGIILLIINNRILKFYEDDDYNTKFTMNKDFKIEEDGSELILNLWKGTIIKNEIWDGKIYEKYIINLKEGIMTYIGIDYNYEIPGGYIEEQYTTKFFKKIYKYIKEYEYILDLFDDIWYDLSNENSGDGEYILYHDNGQISDKRNYVNGLKNGEYISYYENGQIEKEGNYKNGEINGVLTGYYEDGNISYIINNENIIEYYKNGNIKTILNKKGYNTYYENGNLFEEFQHFSGDFIGIGTGYYIDGNIFSNIKLENLILKDYNLQDYYYYYIQNPNKNKIYYDKNGNTLGNFKETSGLYIDMYNNGQISSKGNYIDGEPNGYRIDYYENGQIYRELNYINGNQNGVLTGYYENGNIFYITQYSIKDSSVVYFENGNIFNGIKDGFTTYYDKNGNILGNLTINHYNYKYNGLYISYYSNGEISSKGNYIDGEPDGYHVTYFEDGKIKLEGKYKNGIRVGTRNRYLGDGTIGVSKNYNE